VGGDTWICWEYCGFVISISLISFSDKRLKRDVVKIADDVRGFGWYEYQYIWGGERQVGVMAQEVKDVVPEAVGMDLGFYAVDYERLV